MAIIEFFRGCRKSGGGRFCRLVLFCYVAVFAVMPLAHIHVEPQNAAVSLVEDARASCDRFLVVLHETLSLHFGNGADHECFKRSIPVNITAARSSENRGGAAASATEGMRHHRPSAAPERSLGHRGGGAAPGASLCRSGLSPPSRTSRAS